MSYRVNIQENDVAGHHRKANQPSPERTRKTSARFLVFDFVQNYFAVSKRRGVTPQRL